MVWKNAIQERDDVSWIRVIVAQQKEVKGFERYLEVYINKTWQCIRCMCACLCVRQQRRPSRITVLVACFYNWKDSSAIFFWDSPGGGPDLEKISWFKLLVCWFWSALKKSKWRSWRVCWELNGKVWQSVEGQVSFLKTHSLLFSFACLYGTGQISNTLFPCLFSYRDGHVTKSWSMWHKLELVKALSGKLCFLIQILSHLCLSLSSWMLIWWLALQQPHCWHKRKGKGIIKTSAIMPLNSWFMPAKATFSIYETKIKLYSFQLLFFLSITAKIIFNWCR